MLKRFFCGVSALGLVGCALDPYHLEDPSTLAGLGPDIRSIVKSIKCEVITFIVENRLRNQIHIQELPDKLVNSNSIVDKKLIDERARIVNDYPFLKIDNEQFAAIGIDLKNINTAGINIQNDWKSINKNVTRDYHIGPAYTDTRTFEYSPPIAIAQASDLGPAKNFAVEGNPEPPPASHLTTAYFYQPTVDEKSYCYKSLANSKAKDLIDAANEIQFLVNDDDSYKDYKNFDRIYIQNVPLAKWLQDKATDLSWNATTVYPTTEFFQPGQIYYTFTLDAKPSMDAKFSLTATVISPFLPDLSGSLEHSSTFYIYLNTVDAAASLTAKTGNSCNKSLKKPKCAKKSS